MTAPTREEVNDWLRTAAGGDDQTWAEYMERFAALAFAAGSKSSSTAGAELVPELDQIEEALTDSVRAFEASGMNPKMQNRALWSFMRLRTALLSGARSGEDARDAARLQWMQFHGARVSWGNDDEMCCVVWSDRDGEQYKTALHSDWRAAIDAAMKGQNDA